VKALFRPREADHQSIRLFARAGGTSTFHCAACLRLMTIE
jgi:hypothetical protein